MRALARLFGAKASRFQSSPWPVDAIVRHGPLARLPGELLEGRMRGIEALAEDYAGPVFAMGPRNSGQVMFPVSTPDAFDLYAAGLTVLFTNLGKEVPEVDGWLKEIEEEVGSPTGALAASVFASPRGTKSGLIPHYDPTDNVIIQLAGHKRLMIGQNPRIDYPTAEWHPGFSMREEHLYDFGTNSPPRGPKHPNHIVLKPGSVAFVPAGVWHASQALTDSFSVSLIFTWPRRVDLFVECLRRQLLQHASWRQPLFSAWRSGLSAREVKTLATMLDEVKDEIATIQPRDLPTGVEQLTNRFMALNEDTRFVRMPTRAKLRELSNVGAIWDVRPERGRSSSVAEIEPKFVPGFKWIIKQRGVFTLRSMRKSVTGLSSQDLRDLLLGATQALLIQPIPFRSTGERK